ncbi:MAG TPA: hypothetical protein VNW98_05050 [Burkholderiaceae bacterium]|nr:hypothetical protein [Burkholderiaceae bacterium]
MVSGVAWAGAAFVLAIVVVPLLARHGGDGAGRWLGLVARRAGVLVAVSAPLTILSGIYLFSALHAHDDSAGGSVLKAGAAAALLAAALGVLVSRPAGRKLQQLGQAAQAAAATSDSARQLAALRMRAAVSARVAAALLGVTVLAMGTFRYASALI